MKPFALGSYALYFLGGIVVTIIGSVLPQLLDYYDLSYSIGGRLVFLASGGMVVGVPLSSLLISRMRERSLLSLAALFIAVGQLGILFLPPVAWVFLFTFISSMGVGMIEASVATLMMEVFVGRRAVMMSYLEVSFGVGALIMPIISSLMIAQQAWRFSFLVSGSVGILLVFVWQVISFSKNQEVASESLDASGPQPVITRNTTKWLILALFTAMICMYTGIEGSLNNFLSSAFITYLGAAPYYASLSIGIFWTAMVIGRLATGWVIRKVPYHLFLLYSIILTLAGLICFILFQNIATGFVLVVFLGLTMSGIFSITLVFANHTLPGLSRLVTSMITGFAGIGSAVFPGIIGITIDHAGIATALWCVSGLAGVYTSILLIIFVFYLTRISHS